MIKVCTWLSVDPNWLRKRLQPCAYKCKSTRRQQRGETSQHPRHCFPPDVSAWRYRPSSHCRPRWASTLRRSVTSWALPLLTVLVCLWCCCVSLCQMMLWNISDDATTFNESIWCSPAPASICLTFPRTPSQMNFIENRQFTNNVIWHVLHTVSKSKSPSCAVIWLGACV